MRWHELESKISLFYFFAVDKFNVWERFGVQIIFLAFAVYLVGAVNYGIHPAKPLVAVWVLLPFFQRLVW